MLLELKDVDLAGKRVLIREDLNVPLNDDGQVTDDTRLQCALPTIQQVLDNGAKVMVMSHLGRPIEGQFEGVFSLKPVADYLQKHLGRPVRLVSDWLQGVDISDDEVIVCENVRFNIGEKANDAELAKQMALLCDVFVMDAFATAHRAQASTAGIADYAPASCAGPLLMQELNGLGQALQQPTTPVVAIVGGSKVSSKIDLLTSLLSKVNCLIVGGGIANTLLAAKGFNVQASLYEPEWLDNAQTFFAKAERLGVDVPMPVDVVVAKEFAETADARTCSIGDVQADEMILDIGPKTAEQYAQYLLSAGTIIWNGPVGVFELTPFSQGTQALAEAVAASPAYSIAGGGDTVAAINKYQISEQVSYVSTGGGAFLALLEGEELPAVTALKAHATSVK